MDDLNPELIFSSPFALAALVSAVFELLKNDLPPAKNVWITRVYVLLLTVVIAGLGVILDYLDWQQGLTLVLPAWLIATGIYAALKGIIGKTQQPG